MICNIDKYMLAAINRSNVLSAVQKAGLISKTKINDLTGLSKPTVAKILDEFGDTGIVRSCGKQKSSGGKRAEIYKFAGDEFFSIGVDIGRTNFKAILADLNGKILRSETEPAKKVVPPDDTIGYLAELIFRIIEHADVPKAKILGIGVGMPGILDIESKMVKFSPNFQWENVELLPLLQQKLKGLNLPILLENSNRCQALGEKYYGAGRGCGDLCCINLGYGIGAAVIENEEFYTGSSGTSGEFGHITVNKDGPLCTCGNSGCLEAVASGRAIAQQACDVVKSGIDTRILELAGGNIENIEAETVFRAMEKDDEAAKNLVQKAGEYIGIAIASYISLIDPERIVLAGGMSTEPALLERIQYVMAVRRMRFAGRKVNIVVSKLGQNATAVGAAALNLKQLIKSGGIVTHWDQD